MSPYTLDLDEARRWLDDTSGALDGVVAKHIDGAYLPGQRASSRLNASELLIVWWAGSAMALGAVRSIGDMFEGSRHAFVAWIVIVELSPGPRDEVIADICRSKSDGVEESDASTDLELDILAR